MTTAARKAIRAKKAAVAQKARKSFGKKRQRGPTMAAIGQTLRQTRKVKVILCFFYRFICFTQVSTQYVLLALLLAIEMVFHCHCCGTGEECDRHKDAMAKWGVREESEKKKSKSTKKKSSSKTSKTSSKEPAPAGTEGGFTTKDIEHLLDSSDLSEDVIAKRVQMVVEKRGRRGVDKMEQMRILKRLAELAETVSPQCHLEVLGHLISAEFDTSAGAFTCMPLPIWVETFAAVKLVLSIMEQTKGSYLVFLSGVAEGATPEEIQQVSACILTSFVERLDDDLMKSLQSTDVHSDEYKERLGKSIDILVLLWLTYCFLDGKGFKAQAATVALRVNEHMHYKWAYGYTTSHACA